MKYFFCSSPFLFRFGTKRRKKDETQVKKCLYYLCINHGLEAIRLQGVLASIWLVFRKCTNCYPLKVNNLFTRSLPASRMLSADSFKSQIPRISCTIWFTSKSHTSPSWGTQFCKKNSIHLSSSVCLERRDFRIVSIFQRQLLAGNVFLTTISPTKHYWRLTECIGLHTNVTSP
jgi:hypothetical protein